MRYKVSHPLIQIANSKVGRFLLGNDTGAPIVKITPNSFHVHREKNIFTAHFFSHNQVQKILQPILDKIQIARINSYQVSLNEKSFEHFSGLQNYRDLPQIYLTTTEFDDTAGTGRISYAAGSFADARNATDGYAWGGELVTIVQCTNYGAGYAFNRGFHPYDTSSLTTDVTISSAFHRYTNGAGTLDNTSADSSSVVVVASTQASATTLSAADYDQLGTTSFGSKTLSTFTTTGSASNDIALNATGLAAISKTSYTKLGSRIARDVDNSAPSGTNHANGLNGSAYKLSVTYTPNSILKDVIGGMGIITFPR